MPPPDLRRPGLPPEMPEDLLRGLALGASGKLQLASLARTALGHAGTLALGLDLALAAWEEAPLDGALAGFSQDLDRRAPFLAAGQRAMLQAVRRAWTPPREETPLAALAAQRRHDELLAWLALRLRAEPENLFWLQHLLDMAFFLGRRDMALEALAPGSPVWPAVLEPVRARLEADLAFQGGRLEDAAAGYRRALALRPARFRLGSALHGLGRREEAQAQWRKALALAPWNTNTALRLHDALAGLDRPGPPPPGRMAVCLYTCGKARELDAALAALAASLPPEASVLALDNASPDATPDVLRAWGGRLGERLETHSLPVNVGAPAARNWLLARVRRAGFDFTAYLDDDALLPPDWAGFMGQAVRAYPGAGVWGCKVADLAFPGRIQNADLHLEHAGDPAPAFASLCTQDLDYGQFDYLRPCLSVTGCFHLFRTDRLAACGDFDIRFSPTQYDDLDHDLRLAAQGLPAVYNGHLRVLHARLSGALLHQDRAATGVSQGNLLKLWAKHPGDARAALQAADHAALADDLAAKLRPGENGA